MRGALLGLESEEPLRKRCEWRVSEEEPIPGSLGGHAGLVAGWRDQCGQN